MGMTGISEVISDNKDMDGGKGDLFQYKDDSLGVIKGHISQTKQEGFKYLR